MLTILSRYADERCVGRVAVTYVPTRVELLATATQQCLARANRASVAGAERSVGYCGLMVDRALTTESRLTDTACLLAPRVSIEEWADRHVRCGRTCDLGRPCLEGGGQLGSERCCRRKNA